MNNSIDNLSQIRALVMGNMPRTIVHTARAPVPKGLKDAIEKILLPSDVGSDIIEEDVFSASARAFKDAEDDRAAASALGVLFTEAQKGDDAVHKRVLSGIYEFLRSGRPIYIKEIMTRKDDDSLETLYEGSLFVERSLKSKNSDLVLIAKQLSSLYTFTGEILPDKDNIDDKELDHLAGWFDLICNKLITRCKKVLKDEDFGTQKPEVGKITDREHIKSILSQAENDSKAFSTVIKHIKEHVYGDDIVTWADALDEEVRR